MKKRKVRAAAAAFFAAVLFPAAVFAGGTEFSDVKAADWFYESVTTMAERGVISGNPDGTFKPKDTVTYGEFIAMAVKAVSGKELPAAEAPAHWAQNYYEAGLGNKYFTAGDISESALDVPIPRAYMALISSRILGNDVDVSGEFYTLLENSVKDVEATTPYEYEIIRSYGAGILSGYPDGTFRPDATLLREECASVIWRLADASQRNIPNIADLQEKVQKQQAQQENLSQEERIQAILTDGPQKITFDPAVDETADRDGRIVMKEAKAREYLDQILASLKFYGSGGKYYMTVTLPEVPDGYQVHFGAEITYKIALMKDRWWVNTKEPIVESTRPNQIASTGTITREIVGMNSLAEVYTAHVGMSINKIDDTWLGSEDAGYEVQRSYRDGIRDSFAINRQGSATDVTENYPYTLDRHFTWK